jgi:hypothetical protein
MTLEISQAILQGLYEKNISLSADSLHPFAYGLREFYCLTLLPGRILIHGFSLEGQFQGRNPLTLLG